VTFAASPPTVMDMIERVPPGFVEIHRPVISPVVVDCRAWQSSTLLVLISIEDFGNAGYWMHSSTSFGDRKVIKRKQPSWNELVVVKEAFHGDRPVIQIIPPRSAYVNIAECLHLWERLDGPTIPEVVWRQGCV